MDRQTGCMDWMQLLAGAWVAKGRQGGTQGCWWMRALRRTGVAPAIPGWQRGLKESLATKLPNPIGSQGPQCPSADHQAPKALRPPPPSDSVTSVQKPPATPAPLPHVHSGGYRTAPSPTRRACAHARLHHFSKIIVRHQADSVPLPLRPLGRPPALRGSLPGWPCHTLCIKVSSRARSSSFPDCSHEFFSLLGGRSLKACLCLPFAASKFGCCAALEGAASHPDPHPPRPPPPPWPWLLCLL